MDNADNKELAKKDGVRAATIDVRKKEADAQWSVGMNIVIAIPDVRIFGSISLSGGDRNSND